MNHKTTDYAARGQALRTQQRLASGQRAKIYLAMLVSCAALGAFAAPSLLMDEAIMPHAIDYWQAEVLEATIGEINPRVTTSLDRPDGPIKVPVKQVTSHPVYQEYGNAFLNSTLLGVLAGFGLWIVACIGVHRSFAAAGRTASEDKLISGTELVSEKVLAKRMSKLSEPDAMRIASVLIPKNMETRHIAIAGTTGSGKTTSFRQILDRIEARGQAAIVYDPSGGEFVEQYFSKERGDYLINPWDERSAYWSPFLEISSPPDADRIAAQLIPSSGGKEDDIWTNAARSLLAAILWKMKQQGRTELTDLINVLKCAPREELKRLAQGTAAERAFEPNAEKASASVVFMLQESVKALQYLVHSPEGTRSFSFRQYIRGLDGHQGAKPWVFISRREDQFQAYKPLLSCLLDCAAVEIMALPRSEHRRVFMMIDEFGSLPRIPNLTELLPQSRKFGGCISVGFQSIGQLREKYGRENADVLMGNCNTKLFLQLSDQPTREWASQAIGQEEVEIRTQSDALALDAEKAHASLGTTRQRRAAVIESAFKLPPFEGYLQLPDGHPVARVQLTNDHIIKRGKSKSQGYIPGDEDRLLFSHQPQAPDVSLIDDDGIV